MKGTTTAALLALALGLSPRACPAEGGKAGRIFSYGAGGRPSAMGSACVALADDVSAVYYNPAGLGAVQGNQVLLTRASLYEGAAYNYLAYARQGKTGGWGTQFIQLSVPGAEGRDEFNNPSGGFNYSEQALSFGYGTPAFLDGRLAAGSSFKVLSRSLGSVSNRLYGLDVGARFNPLWAERRTHLGLTVTNVLNGKMGDTDDRLPLELKFGAGWEVLKGFLVGLNVSSEMQFEFGTEYLLGPAALRLGLRDMSPTFGAGVRFLKRWSLDLAVTNHSTLGMANQLSLGCRFGGERIERKVRTVYQGSVDSAEKALERQEYAEALRLFEKASKTTLGQKDPARVRDKQRFARLRELLREMGAETNPQLEKDLARSDEQGRAGLEAVLAFMDRADRKALLWAQAAHGTSADEESFRLLMASIARLTFQKPAEDELLPAKVLVEAKLAKSLDQFETLRYDQAAEECREALMLDPQSALAHERLGSAYFALGLRQKAAAEWKESLRIQPRNDALRTFMRRIGEAAP